MTDFWTADRIEALRMMRKGGFSSNEISARLGCTRNMVVGKLRRLGIPKAVFLDWSVDEVATLKRMYLAGDNFRAIAAECGRPAAACRDKAKRMGLPSRGHDTFRRPTKAIGRKPRAFTPKVVEDLPAPSLDIAVSIVDVTGCKWPVSPDDCARDQHRFCNHPVEELKSYCPYHEAMKRSSPVPVAVPTSLLRAVA